MIYDVLLVPTYYTTSYGTNLPVWDGPQKMISSLELECVGNMLMPKVYFQNNLYFRHNNTCVSYLQIGVLQKVQYSCLHFERNVTQ